MRGFLGSAAFVDSGHVYAAQTAEYAHKAGADNVVQVYEGVDVVFVTHFLHQPAHAFHTGVLGLYINSKHCEVGGCIDENTGH